MLVPVMQSIGTRYSSSTLSTPTCAAPRAPPPESTRQIFGRLAPARRCRRLRGRGGQRRGRQERKSQRGRNDPGDPYHRNTAEIGGPSKVRLSTCLPGFMS